MLLQWVVAILLTDKTEVLHGPFNTVRAAEKYAADYVEVNPKVGSEVRGLHRPH